MAANIPPELASSLVHFHRLCLIVCARDSLWPFDCSPCSICTRANGGLPMTLVGALPHSKAGLDRY